MKKATIIILLIASSFFAFSQDSNRSSFITDKTQTSRLFGNAKVSNLSATELKQVEQIIKTRINQYNAKAEKQQVINVDEYYRQYIVVKNANGEKEVWINFLCRIDYHNNWKTEIIMVKDGGKCYFNVTMNLKTKKINKFTVNGSA
jgi:hypothetical protein